MIDFKNLKVNMETLMTMADKVIIVPHNEIDLDAIGSAIGLSLIAKKLKKPTHIVVDDSFLKIDRGVQLVIKAASQDFSIINRDKYLQMKSEKDAVILTDVNKNYLISIQNDLPSSNQVLVIDHHDPDSTTVKSDYIYIDTHASSASEIVAKLLCMCKIRLTPEIADYLLAGIYLDTNKLSKNVSSETFRTVAKLVENGATLNRVTDLFVEDFVSDRKIQELVNKAKIMTFSVATASGDEDMEYTKEELAKVADYLLRYGVDASFAIGNIGDGVLSISGRSKEKINVGAVMQVLGGGGNPYSGAVKISDTTIEQAEKNLIKVIKPPFSMEV